MDFTSAGYWWLEASPESQVAGTLTFSSARGFDLEIPAGALGGMHNLVERVNRMGSLGESSRAGTVLGVLKDGRHVSLYDCYPTNISLSMPGLPSEAYYAIRGAIGTTHVLADTVVDVVRLRAGLLRDWAGETDLSVSVGFDEAGKSDGTISVSRSPLADRMILSTDLLEVWLQHSGNVSGDPLREVTLLHRLALKFLLLEGILLEDVPHEVVAPVVDFLTLALDSPISLEEIEFQVSGVEGWTQLLFAQHSADEAPENRLVPWMLLPLASEHADASAVLTAWLAAEGDLARASRLVSALIRGQADGVDTRLLLSAQVLESVHRALFESREVKEEVFQQRLDEVLDGCIDKKTRSWALRKLRGSNFKPLSTQLSELCQFAGPAVGRIAPDRDRFLQDLRRCRNYFTHGDEATSEPLSGQDLYVLSEGAVLLAKAVLLRSLGLSPEQTDRVLSENQSFLQMAARTSSAYSTPS